MPSYHYCSLDKAINVIIIWSVLHHMITHSSRMIAGFPYPLFTWLLCPMIVYCRSILAAIMKMITLSPLLKSWLALSHGLACMYVGRYILSELGTCSFFPGSLSAHFLSMDCYPSIAHFADFQVRSLLNRSNKKNSGSLLEKSAITFDRS